MSEQVTFRSKRPAYKVVIKPEDVIVNHNGKVVEKIKGLRGEFSAEGVLVTDNEELIEGLRASDGYNRDFWEDGRPPEAPKPSINEQLAELTRAAAAGDIEAIEAVVETEERTHRRGAVLDAAKSALTAIAEG